MNATHILRLNTSDVSNMSQTADLNIEVQKFWDLDSIGIWETDTVEEQFERNIIFKDGKSLLIYHFARNILFYLITMTLRYID